MDDDARRTDPVGSRHLNDFEWDSEAERDLASVAGNIFGLDEMIDDQDDDEEQSPDEREQRNREWVLVKGLLWHASNTIIDGLFDDIARLGVEPAADAWRDTLYIGSLPPRFGHRYNPLFARMFLVAMVDVTAALAGEWDEPPTVAHELATHLLLTEARSWLQSSELELKCGLLEHLEDALFGDRDFDLLYMRRLDGIEDDELQAGFVNLDFDSWFIPFASGRTPAPYATTPHAAAAE